MKHALTISTAEQSRIAGSFARCDAGAVLRWVAINYGERALFTTGFGLEGCALIHMIATQRLAIQIVTLDTGLFFAESYRLWHELQQRYGLRIARLRPELSLQQQAARHGPRLWERDPDRCCAIRKVAPLKAALQGKAAWITAIRRDQGGLRAKASLLQWEATLGLVKVNPLAFWSRQQLWEFIRAHKVPYNPLHERGYPSIGCRVCTTAVAAGELERAGRWRGRSKTECGIHRPALGREASAQAEPLTGGK